MSANSDTMAADIERHADLILKSSGSGLRFYTVPSIKAAILMAVADCYEQAYRAGAAFAESKATGHSSLQGVGE